MKNIKTALNSTVRGLKKDLGYSPTVVRKIQEKIILNGVCSDTEQEYLSRYSDYARVTFVPKGFEQK
jgi:hypothetical protein